jgi:hypothetical protein
MRPTPRCRAVTSADAAWARLRCRSALRCACCVAELSSATEPVAANDRSMVVKRGTCWGRGADIVMRGTLMVIRRGLHSISIKCR